MTSEALPADLLERVVQAENVAWYEWTMGVEKIRVSAAYAALFDLDPDSVTTQTTFAFLHPDDLEAFRASHVALFKSRDSQLAIEYRFVTRGGAVRWARLRATAERDASGWVTRLTGTISEITEAKQREAENRALLARQEATIAVLRAISASPADPQPVFELIARKVKDLYGAHAVSVVEYDGELLHQRALVGHEPEAAARLLAAFPRPPGPDTGPGRVVLSGKTDYQREPAPGIIQAGKDLNAGSYLGVPLLHEGRVVGVLGLWRADFGAFNEALVEIAQAFAAQAVIAIAGAKTLRELRERDAENRALIARQDASIEVLKAIAASPDDPQPVFELIARRARELCGAAQSGVNEYDGAMGYLRALDGYEPAAAERMRRLYPRPPSPETISGRTILGGQIVHVRDVSADSGLAQGAHDRARDLDTRSLLGVPLLRDGRAIGSIVLRRTEVGGFDDNQIALVRSFAEQAMIAIASANSLRELRERTAELAERNSEYGERIEHQAATIDVLKVMSASPGDAQPVFDLIAERARDVCGGYGVGVYEFDGTLIHHRASTGVSDDPKIRAAHIAGFPRPLTQESPRDLVILERRVIHVRDLIEEYPALPIYGTVKSFVGAPIMRGDTVIGMLGMGSREVGGFSESQIELLKTFAEQAAIAIGSAETYRALQDRTAELALRNDAFAERIDHQAATIDVLKVMSASPGDAQLVFELISERARDICGGYGVGVYEFDGALLHQRAVTGVSADPKVRAEFNAQFPRPLIPGVPRDTAILERRIVHIKDVTKDYTEGRLDGTVKSFVAVPMMRGGVAIGVVGMGGQDVGGFSDTQIELLKTFAEQAVIAITSAETYRALQDRTAALAERNSEFGERIEQQAATIDVLKTMSSTPDDVQPVFDQIVRRARELCNGNAAALFQYDGALVHFRAMHSDLDIRTPAFTSYLAQFPMAPTQGSVPCRAILDRRSIHITDILEEPGLSPAVRTMLTDGNYRSQIVIPLLRDGQAIGCISLTTVKPGGFTDSQIALLETFAEQAVIAIGSAETYRALQDRTAALAQRNSEFGERIEQQAATIDVLKVMSRTPDDTQPVFDQIVQRAKALCNGNSAALFQYDGALVHFRAVHSDLDLQSSAWASYLSQFPMAPTRGSISCRAILDGQSIHIPDSLAEPGLSPAVRALMADGSFRSQIVIPLLRDGQAIGCISLSSAEPGGFTDSQVALLQTFAEQAVIAIGSVATFKALRERTAELTRSVSELQALEEVLRAVNSSLDLETVLSTIISRAVRLSRADEGMIYEYDASEEVFIPKSAFGMTEERIAALRARRIRIGETYLGQSALQRTPVHVEDVQQSGLPEVAELLAGIHAVLAVPLLKENQIVGGMVIRRHTEGGFEPNTVSLMETFAGQCVLAIENARLFQELAARGEEARRARLEAETALNDLQKAQDRLVQTEKLASLGQLTAGIAHEIKNPLNFVNNFSELSTELLDELLDTVAPGKLEMAASLRDDIDDITTMLKSNLEKIVHHGKRADSIVKNMLLHSRTGPSEHRPIDVNATVEEALNLAYHGARAENQQFNITMEKDLDPTAGTIDAYPQEFVRVLLNLIGNGFYAANKRARATPGLEPVLKIATRDLGDHVEIRVRDNGAGIPRDMREKIFEPFFTTKPAGEGTGLGLSLSHDIVVKQHGGQIAVDSQPDTFTEFTILIPRHMAEGVPA